MTSFIKYRQIIVVLFLGLYAFIITPVQLWHRHDCYKGEISKNSRKETTVLQAINKSIDTNCNICSHHYSVYNSTDAIILNLSVFPFNPAKGLDTLAIPSAPYLNSTNKGPPAIA